MRLSPEGIEALQMSLRPLLIDAVDARIFGSRLDDNARGGDLDLFVAFAHPIARPALLTAQIAVRASRALGGRKVDVILSAPNLDFSPIHEVAREQGVSL